MSSPSTGSPPDAFDIAFFFHLSIDMFLRNQLDIPLKSPLQTWNGFSFMFWLERPHNTEKCVWNAWRLFRVDDLSVRWVKRSCRRNPGIVHLGTGVSRKAKLWMGVPFFAFFAGNLVFVKLPFGSHCRFLDSSRNLPRLLALLYVGKEDCVTSPKIRRPLAT